MAVDVLFCFLPAAPACQALLRMHPRGLPGPLLHAAALDILSALSALHDAGLVYGDLKPSNVFVSAAVGTGRATGVGGMPPHFKLGDYGTLREAGRAHLHYFVSGFGFTPEYAAPEVRGRSRTPALLCGQGFHQGWGFIQYTRP